MEIDLKKYPSFAKIITESKPFLGQIRLCPETVDKLLQDVKNPWGLIITFLLARCNSDKNTIFDNLIDMRTALQEAPQSALNEIEEGVKALYNTSKAVPITCVSLEQKRRAGTIVQWHLVKHENDEMSIMVDS